MPDAFEEGQVGLCNNSSSENLIVWLEPWAQEFILPPRMAMVLRCESDIGYDPMPDIDLNDTVITVWGQGGSRISVLIDGVDQDSFSAGYPAPDMGALSPRNFVDLVFGGHPETRPAGLSLASSKRRPWWRLFRPF